MIIFTCQYKGNSFSSSATPVNVDGLRVYLVSPGGGPAFKITPSGIPGLNGRTIWVQSHKPGEIIQPHELVQAMGEGIERTGIQKVG